MPLMAGHHCGMYCTYVAVLAAVERILHLENIRYDGRLLEWTDATKENSTYSPPLSWTLPCVGLLIPPAAGRVIGICLRGGPLLANAVIYRADSDDDTERNDGA
jgi:hypothetical protein